MTTIACTLRCLYGAAALALTLTPAAAQITNAVRPVTLQECFDLALRENLDLQIERYNPTISGISLKIAWAGYDPVVLFQATHTDTVSAGGRDANNIPFEGSNTEADSFRASLAGRGLMGLDYSIGGNVTDTHGDQPDRLNPALRVPFEDTRGGIGINLSQPLLQGFLMDDVRYNIAIARTLVKGAELDLRNQIITIITEVERAYNDVIHARETIKVQEEGLRLAQQLLGDNKKRVQVGILASLDEKQSESEAFARQADLSGARRTFAAAQNRLKALITANYRNLHETTLQPVETLTAVPQTFDIYESWNTALTTRPDVLQARRQVEEQGIVLKFAKNQRLPELNITGGYGYGGSGATEFSDSFGNIAARDQPNWSIGAVATMPLVNKAARENYRRARLVAEQLVLRLKKQEQTVMVEVDDNITSVRTVLDQIESTRQARVYAEQALDGGQKRLQAGTTTSFEVLQLQRDLITARTAEIGAIKDYNNALADLFRAEGSTLERKRIDVQRK
jgi:outer membrane protein